MAFKIGPPARPPLPRPPLQKGPPTNSILEQLLPCFWRDVDFPVSSFKTTFSHDLVQHKYWGVDGVQVEATGRGALEIEATIPFVNGIVPGKDERWASSNGTGLYPDQFRKFLDAMTDKEIGALIHPELGGIFCRPVSMDFSYDPKVRDGVIVTARWIETLNQDQLTPFGPGAVETTAFLAAGDLDSNDTDLRGLAPDMPAFELSFEDMMNGVSGFFDKLSTFKAIAANKPAQILSRITQVEDSLNRAKSPLVWPGLDSAARMKNAIVDLANQKSAGKRTVLRLTTKNKTTIAGLVSQCPGNTSDDLINLNPNLMSNPEINAGSVVRYYAT